MKRFAALLALTFGLGGCSPDGDATGSASSCATKLYPAYNPKALDQCVAVCQKCDHGVATNLQHFVQPKGRPLKNSASLDGEIEKASSPTCGACVPGMQRGGPWAREATNAPRASGSFRLGVMNAGARGELLTEAGVSEKRRWSWNDQALNEFSS